MLVHDIRHGVLVTGMAHGQRGRSGLTGACLGFRAGCTSQVWLQAPLDIYCYIYTPYSSGFNVYCYIYTPYSSGFNEVYKGERINERVISPVKE